MSRDTRDLPTQLTAAFDDLRYPLRDEADLAPVFPDWASTAVETEEVSLSPVELYAALPDDGFPYESASELVAALLAALEEESAQTDAAGREDEPTESG